MTPTHWRDALLIQFPARVQLALASYFVTHGIPLGAVSRADIALALLRIGTEEARGCVELATGKPIQVLPYNPPPWPPRPVAVPPADREGDPRLIRVARNPCLPTTGAFQRYKRLRVGLTEDQLRTRGVTRRDVLRWTRSGHIEFG